MTWDDWDKATMALCLWREARGEGHLGMRAVGHVIYNRHFLSKSPIAQIVCAPLQFSSMTYKNDPQLATFPKSMDAAFQDAMSLSDLICSGQMADITNGATHYFAKSIPPPKWAIDMEQCADIGNHLFFKAKPKEQTQ